MELTKAGTRTSEHWLGAYQPAECCNHANQNRLERILPCLTFAIFLSSVPFVSAAVAPDADRTFTHPSENNRTNVLTLTPGVYTFRTDAEPNAYRVVDWYNTYSGGTPVATAYLYYYDDQDFNITASGWVRAEIYRSDFFNNRYEWLAAYRWNVTVPRVTGLSFRNASGNVINSIEAGQTVYLRADAIGMNGQTISLELWEDDSLGDDQISPPSPVSITIGASGYGTAPWSSVWQRNDGDSPINSYYVYYRVGGVYSGTPNDGHFLVRDTTPPSTFDLSSPANGTVFTTSSIEFSWSASSEPSYASGLASYTLQVDDNSDFSSPLINRTGLTGTSRTETISPEGTYYWRVIAYDANGNTRYSTSTRNFQRQNPRVTSLSFRNGSSSSSSVIASIEAGQTVYLRADAIGMNGQTISVELWEDDGIGDDLITTVTITIGSSGYGTATWSSVYQRNDGDTPINSYYLYYRATGVYSGTPNDGHFLVRDTTSPATFDLSSPANGAVFTSSQVEFSWGASSEPSYASGLRDYILQVDDNADFSSPLINRTGLAASPRTETISSDGTYHWRVIAYDANGNARSSTSTRNFQRQTPIIISAYWVPPLQVAHGSPVVMRAEVAGFSVGDIFSFDVYEDDFPANSKITTSPLTGTVYSSNGKLFVDAIWTAEWEDDFSGDPEYFFKVFRGGVERNSSGASEFELHVRQRRFWSISQTIQDFTLNAATPSASVNIPASALPAGAKLAQVAFHWKATGGTLPPGQEVYLDFFGPAGWNMPRNATITLDGASHVITFQRGNFDANFIASAGQWGMRLSETAGATSVQFEHLYMSLVYYTEFQSHSLSSVPGNTRKLAVFVHGWNPQGRAVEDHYHQGWDDLQSELEEAMLQKSGWAVAKYDWALDASTGELNGLNVIGNLNELDQVLCNPIESMYGGIAHGYELGREIETKCPSLAKVQFISHSAGNWAARGAAKHLKERFPDLQVQVTSLDPFIPTLNGGSLDIRSSQNQYLDTEVWPDAAVFAEMGTFTSFRDAYYTWDDLTDYLPQLGIQIPDAFYFTGKRLEVAGWDIGRLLNSSAFTETADAPLFSATITKYGSSEANGHSGPVYWYSETTRACNDGNGSALSGLGFASSLLYKEVTAQIDSITPSAAQPPTDGITFQGSGTANGGSVVAWEWSSSVDGILSTSASFTKSAYQLRVGTHVISFRVRDNEGNWSDSVSANLIVNNATPTATMSGVPGTPVAAGTMLNLALGGQDNDENGQSIVAGELSVSGSVVATPPPGSYTFTAPAQAGNYSIGYRVRDDEGSWSPPTTRILTVQSPICPFTLSPGGANFGAGGGNGSINVTASASDCSWQSSNPLSWITVTGGANGTGNGTLNYTVAPNTLPDSRTGTLTIAGQPFTITQSGTAPLSRLTDTMLVNGTCRFMLHGVAGEVLTIQASSNLVNWLPLSTHTIPGSGAVLIIDSTMLNQPRRFYRAVPWVPVEIAIPAASGAVTGPFVISNGIVFQTITTTTLTGGRAAYNFTIPVSGDYVVRGIVNALDGGENSFFVNIDAEPQSGSYMVWDIPPTFGVIESRIVSWFGNGPPSQFVPKVFNLSPGPHQLIVRGREANTYLHSLSIVLVTPPTGMVWIPSGTFTMGSPATEALRYSFEGPQTLVTIGRGFWMGKFEVTQGEYLDVMGNNPSGFTGDLRLPVEHVNWSDAVAYCTAMTQRERTAGRLPGGYVFRLPTEAEWEYACRAGTTTAFHYGQALRSGMANFEGHLEYDASVGTIENPSGNYLGQTSTAGSYAPNAWGLYDMHGNVWEWCQDWWTPSLPGGSVTDPTGPQSGSDRLIRGAAYPYRALHLRSAYREGGPPDSRTGHVGFRIVLASE